MPSPGSVAASRALTRVAPVTPRIDSPTRGGPLSRSGVDLEELFGTPDQVTTRRPTPAVTLEFGLEQARGAILRNLGGDALAALDSVWEGARRTEEGWYLRSGALTLLGLPGESDRVAEEGLATRPSSLALRFIQSLARLAVGDVSGARSALQPALEAASGDVLLTVQHALLLARQGDRAGAEALLQRAALPSPEHPALDYGRAAIRATNAESVRNASPPSNVMIDDALLLSGATIEELFAIDDSGVDDVGDSTSEHDVVGDAMRRIGARLASGASSDVARDVRALVRAFSAGGTMVTLGNPQQSHAARVLLTTLLGVFTGEVTDALPPLRTLVQQLAACVREGRADDAERLARKAGTVVREPMVRLLQSLVLGAVEEMARRGRMPPRISSLTPSSGQLVVQGMADAGAVVPVRLGLSLLAESPLTRANARELDRGSWPAREPIMDLYGGVHLPSLALTGRQPTFGLRESEPRDELSGELASRWGAGALSTRTSPASAADDLQAGSGARVVAVLCVVAAAGALSTGHSVVAIALGIGAAWLAVRRSR